MCAETYTCKTEYMGWLLLLPSLAKAVILLVHKSMTGMHLHMFFRIIILHSPAEVLSFMFSAHPFSIRKTQNSKTLHCFRRDLPVIVPVILQSLLGLFFSFCGGKCLLEICILTSPTLTSKKLEGAAFSDTAWTQLILFFCILWCCCHLECKSNTVFMQQQQQDLINGFCINREQIWS